MKKAQKATPAIPFDSKVQSVHIDPSFFLREGSYGIIKQDESNSQKKAAFYHCREIFQKRSYLIRQMLFVHSDDKGRNIAAFIHKVEEKLDVRPRTTFSATHRNNITWINVSSWWSRHNMRRSLFTALLRAGQSYNPQTNNFMRALWSIEYLASTKEAVKRFLDGNTRYTGEITGWYRQFHEIPRYIKLGYTRKRKFDLDKLLVKPKR